MSARVKTIWIGSAILALFPLLSSSQSLPPSLRRDKAQLPFWDLTQNRFKKQAVTTSVSTECALILLRWSV
jgi:hypothetical protein